MNAEDQTGPPCPTPIDDVDSISRMQTSNAEQLQRNITILLNEVDKQALKLRKKIAELLTEEKALRRITNKKESLETLVAQLRDANQNLVIAALGAQDMQAQAEATNRRQVEFLSMLAHELRNPLAPISLAAEFLESLIHAHPELPKLHDIICRQVNHLTRLVDDLMDASRVNSGKVTLRKSVVLISEVLASAVETSKPFIDKRQQHLTLDLESEPIMIDGDLVRLAQLFSNLLINASKFTPERGEISFSVRRHAETVAVSVKDNGMGIAPELQPFIFDLFAQGPSSLDRSQGGLGIGLSLARSIAEMHDGTVQVNSAGLGQGSEFIVKLPISERLPSQNRASKEDGSLPALGHAIRSRSILLIDDNADGNEILIKLLALHGHTTTSVSNGGAGLEMAMSNRYDVILCDVGLPGMNGYEVVQRLHQRSIEPLPLLIAMTGYNQDSYRARAMEAGFDHYLVKPIDTSTLMQLISSRIS